MHQVFYTAPAKEDLKKLDKAIACRIIKKIHFFAHQHNPLAFAKKLADSRLGDYRFRIGDYRAVFDVDSRGNILILMILRIKHRKDIYNL